MTSTPLPQLPRLEDVGQAILELQQMALIKAQPTSEEELDQVTPLVANLRDSLIHHLIRVKAMTKELLGEQKKAGSTTSYNDKNKNNTSSSNNMVNSVAANHEYSNAVSGLLKAIRELFPESLEFSSALIRSSRKWWKQFGTELQPTNLNDLECILEVTGNENQKTQQSQKRAAAAGESEDDEASEEEPDLLSQFANHEEVSNFWWEAVVETICGASSLAECNNHPSAFVENTNVINNDTVIVSSSASFALYCLGPAVSSSAENVAGIVLKRTVALITSLPTLDSSAVVRSVAKLVVKFLLLLSEQKTRILKSMNRKEITDDAFSSKLALLEHQGSLALHRFFTILSQITKSIEHNITRHDTSRSSPATPPQSFLLPLLGVRELVSSKELLDAMYNSCFTNWIRKLVTCPTTYFSPSSYAHHHLDEAASGTSSSSHTNTSNTSCDLDVYLSSLIFCSLRSSRISLSSSVSEHSEKTVCISSNYFLHLIAVELSQHHGTQHHSNNNKQQTDAASAASASNSLDDKLDISTSQLQVLRLAFMHDGIPFPPPRPTEANGIYRNFCPHCLHVCMEVRRVCAVGTNGLVLPLAEEDVAPWANMLWRDGPNAFTGSATSFRKDSPSRRRVFSNNDNDQDERNINEDQEVSPKLRSALLTSSALKRHPQHTSTISQAEIPRLYSPVQRAAAVFKLALLEGGISVASPSSSSGNNNSTSAADGSNASSSFSDVGRVPVVVWASAAEGLLEILEQDISVLDYHANTTNNNNNNSSSSQLDTATFLTVASAATVASFASLLKFPCDRALMRFNRVLKCRTRRGWKNPQERETLFRLIEEINPNRQRPRTSELFDNVNPLIFAEWEKIFARCCEEALRAPSISMQRLMASADFLFSSVGERKSPTATSNNKNNNQQQEKKEIPKPSRESSLSEKEGQRVIVWLDSTMTTTFLFGMDPSSSKSNLNFENTRGSDSAPTSATPSVGGGPQSRRPSEFISPADEEKSKRRQERRDNQQKEKDLKRKQKEKEKLLKKKKQEALAKRFPGRKQKVESSSSSSSSSSSDYSDTTSLDSEDDENNNKLAPEQKWIPIWVSLLPDGAAAASGREREISSSSKYHGCCGIVCADTSLNCPLRPNDLVFFTPASPEENLDQQQQQSSNSQPEVLFPRVVLRAWRLVPGASATVPNIAIRQLPGAKKSFRLTMTSGEPGYTPLQLVAGACDDDPGIVHWPLAQWWGLLRELGRREEVKNQQLARTAAAAATTSTNSSSSSQSNSASGTSIFSTFGPDFVHSASKGSLRSFWCSLRDITVPVLSSSRHMHPSCMYWKVDRKRMGIETSLNSTSSCVWPPPYAALGANFGVATSMMENGSNGFELDSWRSTAMLEIGDAFLEAAEE